MAFEFFCLIIYWVIVPVHWEGSGQTLMER